MSARPGTRKKLDADYNLQVRAMSYIPDRDEQLLPCTLGAIRGRDWWFPEGARKKGGKAYEQPEAEAAQLCCKLCPIRQPCLNDAMTLEWGLPQSERHGIWGAMNPMERAEYEKALKAKGLGPPKSERKAGIATL